MFGPKKSGPESDPYEERTFSPEEKAAYESGLDRVAEEKRQALLDPGPSWREWFFHSAAKWYVALLFLIVDSWVAAYFFHPLDLLELVPAVAVALYVEAVAWMYLWHRPTDTASIERGRFRRRWWRPFPHGRWTPEGERARSGAPLPAPSPESGPDPHEFL